MTDFVKRAFPVLADTGTGLKCVDVGMSLRDWFAGQAMAFARENVPPMAMPLGGYQEWIDAVAIDAYKYADAMMKARCADQTQDR